jgi:hypothetical protein
VWSAIGVLPLAVQFGFDVVQEFLAGGHSIDRNLIEEESIKVLFYLSLEKYSNAFGIVGILQNHDPKLFCQSNCTILSGPLQIRSTHPATRHGEQWKENQHKRRGD